MESRAMPSVTRLLVVVLQKTAGSRRQQRQPITVLLVVVVLVFQAVCSAAANACPTGCSCQENGEQVSCVGLPSIPRILGRSHKTLTLRITQHRTTKVSSASFRGLEDVEALEISEGRLSEISNDAFFSLRHLKKLNLSHNELTLLPRNAFLACSALEQLDLSGNPLVLPSTGPMLASNSLSALDISFCSLSKLSNDVFSKMPALTELRLCNNNLEVVSECTLQPIKELVLLDADPTMRWTTCSLQDTTTQQPTDRHGYAQMALIPTLPQWIFLVVSVLFLVLLLTSIHIACQRLKRREKHHYGILNGSQIAKFPVAPYPDFRTSRISTKSYDFMIDPGLVSVVNGESTQYLPNNCQSGSTFQSQIPLLYRTSPQEMITKVQSSSTLSTM